MPANDRARLILRRAGAATLSLAVAWGWWSLDQTSYLARVVTALLLDGRAWVGW